MNRQSFLPFLILMFFLGCTVPRKQMEKTNSVITSKSEGESKVSNQTQVVTSSLIIKNSNTEISGNLQNIQEEKYDMSQNLETTEDILSEIRGTVNSKNAPRLRRLLNAINRMREKIESQNREASSEELKILELRAMVAKNLMAAD